MRIIIITGSLLKLGKPGGDAASYKPVALLSVCYKLLERLTYNRIMPSLIKLY